MSRWHTETLLHNGCASSSDVDSLWGHVQVQIYWSVWKMLSMPTIIKLDSEELTYFGVTFAKRTQRFDPRLRTLVTHWWPVTWPRYWCASVTHGWILVQISRSSCRLPIYDPGLWKRLEMSGSFHNFAPRQIKSLLLSIWLLEPWTIIYMYVLFSMLSSVRLRRVLLIFLYDVDSRVWFTRSDFPMLVWYTNTQYTLCSWHSNNVIWYECWCEIR